MTCPHVVTSAEAAGPPSLAVRTSEPPTRKPYSSGGQAVALISLPVTPVTACSGVPFPRDLAHGDAEENDILSQPNRWRLSAPVTQSGAENLGGQTISTIGRPTRLPTPSSLPSDDSGEEMRSVSSHDGVVASVKPTVDRSPDASRFPVPLRPIVLPSPSRPSADTATPRPAVATSRPVAAPVRPAATPRVTSVNSTLHATRLRTQGRETLTRVHQSLKRRSTHTANKQALEALHAIVASRDAAGETNVYGLRLQAALTAIREAEDFCGRYGNVDHLALRRMIESHTTEALKDRDVSGLSAVKAVEIYLSVAKSNLVAASGGLPEAGDALLLLGHVHQKFEKNNSLYNEAVALTLHQAAVEVQPASAIARRELGKTLMNQGLVAQAVDMFVLSNRLTPNRETTQLLLNAARRIGNVPLAEHCMARLQDPRLPSDFPVIRLSPEQFAATSEKRGTSPLGSSNRQRDSVASAVDAEQNTRIAQQPTAAGAAAEPTPTWFPFWRR